MFDDLGVLVLWAEQDEIGIGSGFHCVSGGPVKQIPFSCCLFIPVDVNCSQ